MVERGHEQHPSPETLLHSESYTEEELSELTGIGTYEIRRAAREGRLRATVIDGEVIRIERDNALAWMKSLT